MTIIMIDEDDATTTKMMTTHRWAFHYWCLTYDERFKECFFVLHKKKGMLVRTDHHNVRDNWPILMVFSRDHIGLSFYQLELI